MGRGALGDAPRSRDLVVSGERAEPLVSVTALGAENSEVSPLEAYEVYGLCRGGDRLPRRDLGGR